MIWTENRTTKKSIHTQRVLEAYLREKNATQQPHQRQKLRSQLCLKYSQAILISCWFFFPAWERRYYDFALVVLFIIRSFILAKVNECFLSLLLSSLSLFYRCDGFLSLLLEFFFGMLLLVLRRPRNRKYINNKTGIKPAAKMTCNRDTHEWFVFSTWLDVYTVFHCSILSIRTTMPNRYYLLGKGKREKKWIKYH